jgi:hypothetical protein
VWEGLSVVVCFFVFYNAMKGSRNARQPSKVRSSRDTVGIMHGNAVEAVSGSCVSKTRGMQRQGGWGRRGLGIKDWGTAVACFLVGLAMAAGGESVDAGARAWAALAARSGSLGRSQAFAAYAPLHAGLDRPPGAVAADKATGRHAQRLHVSRRLACRQSNRAARAAAARDSQAEGVRGQALHSVLEELYGIVPGSKHQVWSSLGSEEVTPLLRPLALRVRVVGLPGAHGMPHRRDARAPRDAIPGRV